MTSLYNQINQRSQQLPNNIQQIIQMAKTTQNPQQLLNILSQQNPQVSQFMQMINTNNITPKQLFMNMANQRGVNPNDIIAMFK